MSRAQELLADDPWWLVAGKTVVIFGFLVGMVLATMWIERRVVARMQMRIGPNRVGPAGLGQGLADGIKLGLKEDIIPKAADRVVFVLAPVLSTVPAFLAFAVIPIGPEVSVFGERTVLQLTDFPVAVLYILAVASVGIYGIVLAGWASGSTYPLLGSLRSSAQLISYEVAMGLSFVAVFLYAGSMSTAQIVESQQRVWYAIALLPSFLIYLVSMVGETNRAPFDLPEAEGELVGGFHTEYSSLKFALFFLAEYVNMVTVSALATTLFLGGWRAPWPLSTWDGANTGWLPVLWFLVKVFALLFVFIWLRGTLPRLRYDQFMRLGWKVLIPASLAWIVMVATIRALTNADAGTGRRDLIVWLALGIGAILLVLLAADFLSAYRGSSRSGGRRRSGAEPGEGDVTGVSSKSFDPLAGGYPVPPMPGQRPVTLAARPGSVDSTVETVPVGARAGGGGPDDTYSTQEIRPRG